ncbi:putative ribosomal-protein-alanine acetyltransferase [Acetobacteraceae bacterium AT-5844]|nr:putative ribosomal-protein-alanine acetyltransferase [Acetobacteraceae bacterium AT-5844]
MTLEPRPVLPADLAQLEALHASAFPPGEAWSADALGVMLALAGGFGLLLENRGFILARAVGEEAEILTLAVAPLARRCGAGTALLAAALRRAADCGARELFLEVSRNNIAAFALYAAAGFTQVGLRRRYYADGSDALVLRRDLSAA